MRALRSRNDPKRRFSRRASWRMLKPHADRSARARRAAATTKDAIAPCAASSASSGPSPSPERLIESLKRLEYRGYDSRRRRRAWSDGKLERRRAPGKMRGAGGGAGRASRWPPRSASATPAGPPTARRPTRNAHPHIAGRVTLVHNGIIENFAELKAELQADGPRLRERHRHRGDRPPDRRRAGRPAWRRSTPSRRRSTG